MRDLTIITIMIQLSTNLRMCSYEFFGYKTMYKFPKISLSTLS